MSDEDETNTSGIFSSLLGGDDADEPGFDETTVDETTVEETTVDETTVDDMAVVASSRAGRDWTFILAWALIGMGVLFVLWALITNG